MSSALSTERLQLPGGRAARKARREASLSGLRREGGGAAHPRRAGRRAWQAGKGSPARAAEDGGAASASGPASAAAADGPGGALGAAGRGGGASSGRRAGALGDAGGRPGAGLRPGAALPPPPAAAEGEPAEPDEGGCTELRPEHQHRQRAENQRSSSAESGQKPGGILRLVRPARTLSAPGLRVPFPELRQRQALAHSGAHRHQARRGPGREPALHPVPQHDQVPDLLCQGHPQRPPGVLQQDHGQDALSGDLVTCRLRLDYGTHTPRTEEPSGLPEAEAGFWASVFPSVHLCSFFRPYPVRGSSFRQCLRQVQKVFHPQAVNLSQAVASQFFLLLFSIKRTPRGGLPPTVLPTTAGNFRTDYSKDDLSQRQINVFLQLSTQKMELGTKCHFLYGPRCQMCIYKKMTSGLRRKLLESYLFAFVHFSVMLDWRHCNPIKSA